MWVRGPPPDMLLTADLSHVKKYEAAKDRYFFLAASSVSLPFGASCCPIPFLFFFLPTSFPTSGRLVLPLGTTPKVGEGDSGG